MAKRQQTCTTTNPAVDIEALDVYTRNASSDPVYVSEQPITSVLTGDISGSTTEVEIKVGASKQSNRRMVIIQNTGTLRIWIGPTGVDAGGTTDPGIFIEPTQVAKIRGTAASLSWYAISTGSFTANVQEWGL